MKKLILSLAMVSVAAGAFVAFDADAAGKLITRKQAARNCTQGFAFVYRGEQSPRWSCNGDYANKKGPVRKFDVLEPVGAEAVVIGGIPGAKDKCEQLTGHRKLKGMTVQGKFICAGRPGTDVLDGLEDE